jgi:CRISPR/Cas system-associated protein Csm6
MSNLIIFTTVGTSVLTNFLDEEKNPSLKTNERYSFSNQIKSLKENRYNKARKFDDGDWRRLKEDWEDEDDYSENSSLKSNLINWANRNEESAAELQSINLIRGDKTENETKVYLLTSDTMDGYFSGFVLQEALKTKGIESSLKRINDLVPDEGDLATTAFNNLISYITDTKSELEKYIKLFKSNKEISDYDYVINITGGYKAAIPFLTIIGQLHEITLKYLYEDSDILVEVGNLPINFDWELGELYLDDLSKEGLRKMDTKPDILDLLRKFNLIEKSKNKLTPLGRLFSNHLRGQLDAKKGTLGYLVELKVFEYFIHKKINTLRGKEFWWDKTDRSKFSYQAQYEQDDKLEQKIDIDICLSDDISEAWYEVKSYSKTGLKKAKKQIETMLDFIKETSYDKVKNIGLILYKLETTDLIFYKEEIEGIEVLFNSQDIDFILYSIDIPVNINGIFNVKGFFEQKEINLRHTENILSVNT